MSVIAPTVTAYDTHQYREQLERVEGFAKRIHIDVMDGIFAPTKSPPLSSLWLPESIICDLHIMYQHPENCFKDILRLKPSLVIVHAEAQCDIPLFAGELANYGIRTGIALLQDTSVKDHISDMHACSHCLIFSGKLGFHGGVADLSLLKKIDDIHSTHPGIEIGWDGGIQKNNIKELARYVDVLNVGGAIQHANDPLNAYSMLVKALHEA